MAARRAVTTDGILRRYRQSPLFETPTEAPGSATPAAYCFGCIVTDPISRVFSVTQLICRSYPLGVVVWKLL
jgi:hypothetical protein